MEDYIYHYKLDSYHKHVFDCMVQAQLGELLVKHFDCNPVLNILCFGDFPNFVSMSSRPTKVACQCVEGHPKHEHYWIAFQVHPRNHPPVKSLQRIVKDLVTDLYYFRYEHITDTSCLYSKVFPGVLNGMAFANYRKQAEHDIDRLCFRGTQFRVNPNGYIAFASACNQQIESLIKAMRRWNIIDAR